MHMSTIEALPEDKIIENEICEIKKEEEQKENIYKNIIDIDRMIREMEENHTDSSDSWGKVIALCNKQEELFTECNRKRWTIPQVHYKQPDQTVERYSHYCLMKEVDEILSSQRGELRTGKQYTSYLVYCASQEKNISKCIQNKWKVPILQNPDPEKLSSSVQEEQKKRARAKYIKTSAIIVLVIIGIASALGLLRLHDYRASRAKIPFDASSAIGQDQESIYTKLKDAGFKNIRLKEDDSGWLKGNEVTDIKIMDSDSFTKGSYIKPDEDVVITYSSADRVYVTDLLKDWRTSSYTDVVQSLKEAGFSDIVLQEVITSDKKLDQLPAKLSLNNKEYSDEVCYLPSEALIELSYYAFLVEIGSDNEHFIGKSYTKTVDNLKKKGFTNVQTKEITDGLCKSKTIIEVTVDDNTSYQSDQYFPPDTKIVVKYSSEGRVDLTSDLQNWESLDYSALRDTLSEKGIKTINVKSMSTSDKSKNKLVSSILINDEKYTGGDCFVPTDAKIQINYHKLKITLSQSAKEITKGKQYSEVLKILQKKGFTNIVLKRANDIGWFPIHDKEGSIKSLTIDGKSDFKAWKSFYYDDPIVIVVHTKKDSGCEDITMIDN